MRHAELLKDPQCLERGNHLVKLYIDGLTRLRAGGPSEEEELHNYGRDIDKLIDKAAEQDDMDDAALAQFGRSIIETRRKQVVIKAWRERPEVGTFAWHTAFGPAIDFLTEHASKPIAAEDVRENALAISSYKVWSERRPRRIGGFVIPMVIGNAQLRISGRAGSNRAVAQLQVFDRLKADTYGTHLKIAIAE